MTNSSGKFAWCIVGAMALLSLRVLGATADVEFFEKKIRPVLAEHCYECHSAASKRIKGGLRVDNREALLQGGDTGPALVPGKPEMSLLLTAVSHRDENLVMPPKKPKLGDAIQADLERWIKEGAIWSGNETNAVAVDDDRFDLKERKQRWSWIWDTPRQQEPPAVKDSAWPQSKTDRFILARLEKEGLRPAPPAAPEIWLRRVYFALIGLPPSSGEIKAFLNDQSPQARELVVDRLLAAPQFGERWARHWLDLVRYAESRGHEDDFIIPNAYEYRDYVIRALNADVPYDVFVREHIAGDLATPPRRNPEQGFNESILGTGWAFLGEEIHAPVDTRLDENERIDNRIDVLSKTFLGLTVSCARCHDHKFDAITQKDYYALAGYFISSGQRLVRFETLEAEQSAAKQLAGAQKKWSNKLAKTIAEDQRATLAKLQNYLAAACETIRADTNFPAASETILPATMEPAIARRAAEQSLETSQLRSWVSALARAEKDPNDVLHPLLSLAHGKRVEAPQGPDLAPPTDARVVVNFGKLAPSEWFADGVAFGTAPVRAGELKLIAPHGTNASRLRVVTRSGAWVDADWRDLELSAGVEREPTLYGKSKRDGLMLRSPKFELTSGKLHFLVRGSGRIFTALDSQRLVTGPVHTVLVKEWAHQDGWHWISQDLSEYAGHRVAVEFSPSDDFDTAVAMIVEAAQVPPRPSSMAQRLRRLLEDRNANSIAEAATVYQEVFSNAVATLGNEQSSELALAIQDWVVQRPELFTGTNQWREPVTAAVIAWLKERAPIIASVPRNSRTAPAMLEGNGVDEYLLVRGKHESPKGLVPRRFLEAVAGTDSPHELTGSGRKQLADVLTDPANPLVARVMVNRVWHHLFGRGLVASVDNFGWLGQRPTHPELLDDLAVSFRTQDNWSLKKLLRRLVLSSTYAMSSKPDDAAAEQHDPENLLLHRMNLKRLEGEAIRDAVLTVSGRLDRKTLGPSIPLHPSQFIEARGLRAERGPLDGEGRRSIYIAARRNFLPMMMTAFDTPTPFTTVGRRNVSNVPGQMLFLMNDPFVHEQAQVWARRLLAELPEATTEERMRWLWLTAYGREATREELKRCDDMLREVKANGVTDPAALWTEICHALFGVKEFIYVR